MAFFCPWLNVAGSGRNFAAVARKRFEPTKAIMERQTTIHGDQSLMFLARVILAGLLLVLFITISPQAIGEAKARIGNAPCDVTFQVKLIPAHSARHWQESSHVVVWLVPITPSLLDMPRSASLHYRIIQHHKKFEPRVLVVPAGSTVEFPNQDPWLHNVFSVSRSRRFDLGLYHAGVRKAVTFDRPGVSHLFCSIHPEMMAIVVTVDSAYFGVSDRTGHISIAGVPHGKYVLHLWHENSAPQVLEALQRTISVGDDNRSLPTISIALADEVPMISENGNSEQATFASGK